MALRYAAGTPTAAVSTARIQSEFTSAMTGPESPESSESGMVTSTKSTSSPPATVATRTSHRSCLRSSPVDRLYRPRIASTVASEAPSSANAPIVDPDGVADMDAGRAVLPPGRAPGLDVSQDGRPIREARIADDERRADRMPGGGRRTHDARDGQHGGEGDDRPREHLRGARA